MGIPLIKIFLTTLRLTLRPINNRLIQLIRSTKENSRSELLFIRFGNLANAYEVKLNRMMIGSKGLGTIENLHDTLAFNKCIDWFTEIFFYYGVMCSIVFWEIWKS